MPQLSEVLNAPEDHGFAFVVEDVEKDGITYAGVPLIVVNDVTKFEASFPGVILAALDGSSIRVSAQRIVRDARSKGVKDLDNLKTRLVNWLLGVRAPAFTKVIVKFAGPEGKQFESEADAKAAWVDWALAQ